MTVLSPLTHAALDAEPKREWLASLHLGYTPRRNRTQLIENTHCGPLRVQRPFFPEEDGCNHTYILHPPGGMAVGDRLSIYVDAQAQSKVLLTTPSAGKMYGLKGLKNREALYQSQYVYIKLADGAECEWLPQETIIFDGAQARLSTRVSLKGQAKFFGWDIVRLGRIASGETFKEGYCLQSIELERDGVLQFVEKTPLYAQSEMLTAAWGLQNQHTLATCIATVTLTREQIDDLIEALREHDEMNTGEAKNKKRSVSSWGITQKDDVFIARYLGSSILHCRSGLELLWKTIRPIVMRKAAVVPRIWNT